MQINIHWGEFIGPVNRTEVKKNTLNKETGNANTLHKYDVDLRGYLPFALYKNVQTNQWLSAEAVDAAISEQVIFYTKQIVDDYEDKYNL
jgi:hypothetical protein